MVVFWFFLSFLNFFFLFVLNVQVSISKIEYCESLNCYEGNFIFESLTIIIRDPCSCVLRLRWHKEMEKTLPFKESSVFGNIPPSGYSFILVIVLFFYFFSISTFYYYTISLSCHEQVCPLKHTCSWHDKLIVLWILNRQAKISLCILFLLLLKNIFIS